MKDNGAVTGVNQEEEYHMIDLACQSHCKPAIPFDACLEGRRAFGPGSPDPPLGQPPAFLRRRNRQVASLFAQEDRIHRASPVQVKVWQYEMRMDRSEFRYDQFIGKLFNAWRDGRQLRLAGARVARLRYEDAEDLLCLLIVWNIIEWERGARGLVYQPTDASALDELRPAAPSNSDGKIIRDPQQYSEL